MKVSHSKLHLLAYRESRRWVCPEIFKPPSTKLTTPTPSCVDILVGNINICNSPDWTGHCTVSTEWWSWSAGSFQRGISGRGRGSTSSAPRCPSLRTESVTGWRTITSDIITRHRPASPRPSSGVSSASRGQPQHGPGTGGNYGVSLHSDQHQTVPLYCNAMFWSILTVNTQHEIVGCILNS